MAPRSVPIHTLSPDEISKDLAPVRKLVDVVLLIALSDRASHIILEPRHDLYRVAIRVGGQEYEMVPPPLDLARGISQRFKVLGDLDICNHRSSQEGRMRLVVGEETAEIQISIDPTPHGEAIRLTIQTGPNTSEQARKALVAASTKLSESRERISWLQRVWRKLISFGV